MKLVDRNGSPVTNKELVTAVTKDTAKNVAVALVCTVAAPYILAGVYKGYKKIKSLRK